jgi:hypothetical protein
MPDELTADWILKQMSDEKPEPIVFSFTVAETKMVVASRDKFGFPSITAITLIGPSAKDSRLHRAWLGFVMDDRYKPVKPEYSPDLGQVGAIFPLSALAGMLHVLRTDSVCSYTTYGNGIATVEVKSA